MAKKFKAIEKKPKNGPIKENLEWEGETLQTDSKINLADDKGAGQAVILRFFEFGVNPEAFKKQQPTAQMLFNSHLRGMESMLWKDGLKVYADVEPRFMFSKDKTKYRFIIPAIASNSYGAMTLEKDAKSLSQIANESTRNPV